MGLGRSTLLTSCTTEHLQPGRVVQLVTALGGSSGVSPGEALGSAQSRVSGEPIPSSGLGCAAHEEQHVWICLVSAALPLEMEGFRSSTPEDAGVVWGSLCPPLLAGRFKAGALRGRGCSSLCPRKV